MQGPPSPTVAVDAFPVFARSDATGTTDTAAMQPPDAPYHHSIAVYVTLLGEPPAVERDGRRIHQPTVGEAAHEGRVHHVGPFAGRSRFERGDGHFKVVRLHSLSSARKATYAERVSLIPIFTTTPTTAIFDDSEHIRSRGSDGSSGSPPPSSITMTT